jgi:hypothetical protein
MIDYSTLSFAPEEPTKGIKNGQVVARTSTWYAPGRYENEEVRIRKLDNILVLTITTDRPGRLADMGERVMYEQFRAAWVKHLDPGFAQSTLFTKLASDNTLKKRNIYAVPDGFQLDSQWTRDNETIIDPARFTMPAPGHELEEEEEEEDTSSGLTFDQLLPYFAGGLILLGAFLIYKLTRKS